MSNEEMNELFYSLQQECASRATQIAPTWEDIVARQAQTFTSQQAYNFEGGGGGGNCFNNHASYFSHPQNIFLSYNYSGWGTYGNFSHGHPIIQNQGSSSSYYQEQFWQPYDEELFLVLKEEIKRDNEAL